MFEDFHNGDLLVLCSVNVLCEVRVAGCLELVGEMVDVFAMEHPTGLGGARHVMYCDVL